MANVSLPKDSEAVMHSSPNPCFGYALSGLVFFTAVNFSTRYAIPGAVRETKRRDPAGVRWRWRNILTSFVHSSITGVWAPLAFVLTPSLGANMIHAYSNSAHALVSISFGYFIYDFCDMAIYHRRGSTYELLIHHTMVIICFGIAITTRTYVAYAALSLNVEVNSIFLHARQLLNIGGVPKSSWIYRANGLMNVGTFVLFRILLLGWMTRWLTLHRDDVPLAFFTIGSVGLATIVTMNIILLYRIIAGDYMNKDKAAVMEPFATESIDNEEPVSGNAVPLPKRATSGVDHMMRSLFDDRLDGEVVAKKIE